VVGREEVVEVKRERRSGARFQDNQKTMKVTPRAYDKVMVIRESLEEQEKRQVTYSETIDRMADLWNRAVEAVNALEEP
jgi:hypothetical protein